MCPVTINSSINRIPPQAIEVERDVLGSMMVDRSACSLAFERLKPEQFYMSGHQQIFRVMMNLYIASNPIDLLTVEQGLRDKNQLEHIGGSSYLADLTRSMSSAANVDYFASVIIEKWVKRQLIQISSSIATSAYDDNADPDQLLDNAQAQLFELAGDEQGNMHEIADTMQAVIQQISKHMSEGTQPGIRSGLDVDHIIGGFRNACLYLIGARPSMGKTALALEIMRRMARNNLPSGIISLETSHTNLGYRLLSQTSGIPAHQILNAQLSQNELDKLMKAASQLSELGIVIDDSVGLSVTKLRAKARQMKQKHNISALFIDYVQLLQAEGYNRENQVANISRACKAVAKELDIPVIALAQLSRDLEKRGGDKRPIMSDLRESGQLEQDADVIMFLHRPEYYGVATDALGNSTEGICEVIVAKNKEGKTGVKNLEFDKERMMFSNLDPIMHKAKPKKDQTLTDTTINDYSPF